MPNPEEKPQTSSAPNGATRRKFLQGAVAAMAAPAVMNQQNLQKVIHSFTPSSAIISGAKSGICLTGNTSPFVTLPGNQIRNSHKFVLWFWINNASQGAKSTTYTLSYTLALVSGPGPAPGAFPAPFEYSGNNSSQHNYILPDNTAGCPGTVPASNKDGATLGDIAAVKLSGGAANSTSDILWELQLDYAGATLTGNTTYQFQGTVTDSNGNTISSSINLTVTT